MFDDTVDLPVPPAGIIGAVPAVLQRLAAVQFGPDGVAIVDGAPLGGLRLVGGRHMSTGAQYALVVEERESDGDIDHDAVFLSIERLDQGQLAVLAVKPEKHTADRQSRWIIDHPLADIPSRIRYSSTKVDDERYPQTLHLDLDPAKVAAGAAQPVGTLDLQAMGVHAELALVLTTPTTLRYRGDYVEGAPTGFFAGMKRKVAEKIVSGLLRAVVRSWARAAQHGDASDPAAVLWAVSVGQLALSPKKGVRRYIERTLAA